MKLSENKNLSDSFVWMCRGKLIEAQIKFERASVFSF